MKISEMTSAQAAECLIRIAAPVGNICDDEELVEILKKFAEMREGTENIRAVGRLLPEILMFSLKTHRTDLFEVVGALIDKTTEEVAEMPFVELLKAIRESYDEVLKDFFISTLKPGSGTEG